MCLAICGSVIPIESSILSTTSEPYMLYALCVLTRTKAYLH